MGRPVINHKRVLIRRNCGGDVTTWNSKCWRSCVRCDFLNQSRTEELVGRILNVWIED